MDEATGLATHHLDSEAAEAAGLRKPLRAKRLTPMPALSRWRAWSTSFVVASLDDPTHDQGQAGVPPSGRWWLCIPRRRWRFIARRWRGWCWVVGEIAD
jgi:hypothetical protein